MALRTFNPTTPGQRQLIIVDRSGLYRGKPVKALTEGKNSTGGRNSNGRITVRFRAGGHVDVKPGNTMPLANIPLGTVVHNIEIKIGKGGQIARSAGTYAQIVGRDGEYVIVRLNSGEQRLVHGRCMASIGAVSNPDNMNISIGKAGRKRWMGRMPHNRGVSMNPVDRPHGGGEGRTSGGRHPVSPWGQPTKGHRTRHNKRTDTMIVKRRK